MRERNDDSVIEWPRLVRGIALPLSLGGVGALFTNDGLKEWYPALRKPSFNPPNSIFGPVWTTLYLLMGVADYLVAQHGGDDRLRQNAERLYHVQLGLNLGWSAIFFKLRSPLAALIELVTLWFAIVLTIRAFARVSRPAALLLVPYLLWTTFAAALNASIWWLNRK